MEKKEIFKTDLETEKVFYLYTLYVRPKDKFN